MVPHFVVYITKGCIPIVYLIRLHKIGIDNIGHDTTWVVGLTRTKDENLYHVTEQMSHKLPFSLILGDDTTLVVDLTRTIY